MSLRAYLVWTSEHSDCKDEKLVDAGLYRVGESALKDFARTLQASVEARDDLPWDVSVRAEGRTLENPHVNSPTRVKASDGDSITVSVRLVGFATAESRKQHTDCDAELELGKKAKVRLQGLIAGGSLELIYVRCSCSEETYGTEQCNFGRPCAVLRSHGRDVGEILIGEGLAVPIRCGETSCPPQPDWCPPKAKEIP